MDMPNHLVLIVRYWLCAKILWRKYKGWSQTARFLSHPGILRPFINQYLVFSSVHCWMSGLKHVTLGYIRWVLESCWVCWIFDWGQWIWHWRIVYSISKSWYRSNKLKKIFDNFTFEFMIESLLPLLQCQCRNWAGLLIRQRTLSGRNKWEIWCLWIWLHFKG